MVLHHITVKHDGISHLVEFDTDDGFEVTFPVFFSFPLPPSLSASHSLCDVYPFLSHNGISCFSFPGFQISSFLTYHDFSGESKKFSSQLDMEIDHKIYSCHEMEMEYNFSEMLKSVTFSLDNSLFTWMEMDYALCKKLNFLAFEFCWCRRHEMKIYHNFVNVESCY
mgnify:CR=1 FL=1